MDWVLSALRHGRDAAGADRALAAWATNDVVRFSHGPYLDTVWRRRHDFTAYDAAYVALAIHLEAALLTADRRLAAVAVRHCDVVVAG